jgi:hypothetical protein
MSFEGGITTSTIFTSSALASDDWTVDDSPDSSSFTVSESRPQAAR